MGHYDTSRDGNCRRCGQALAYCSCARGKREPAMEDLTKGLATALQARRRELIARPLDRCWDELALAAIEFLKKETSDE